MPTVDAAAASTFRLLAREATGELEFRNDTASAINLTGYTIQSASGSLLPEGWTPIAGRLDATGDATFDSDEAWTVFSAPLSTTDLSEGVALGDGGLLAAGESVSIGPGWDAGFAFDLTASALIDNISVAIDVLAIPVGDYDSDGDVDTDDLTVFTDTFGSTTDLRADGNLDGVVDGIDYSIWREALQPSPVAASSLLATPEPATAVAFSVSVLLMSATHRVREMPRRETRRPTRLR